eukprot:404995_1
MMGTNVFNIDHVYLYVASNSERYLIHPCHVLIISQIYTCILHGKKYIFNIFPNKSTLKFIMTQPKSDIVDAKTSKCKFSSLSKKKELFNYIPDEKENVSSSQFIQCNADSKKQYMYKQKKNKNKRRKMDSHIEQQRAAKRQKLNNITTSSTLSLKKT